MASSRAELCLSLIGWVIAGGGAKHFLLLQGEQSSIGLQGLSLPVGFTVESSPCQTS